jgi:hypothetical protein
MNNTTKRASGKQVGQWALEALLPGILLWVGIGQLISGYDKLGRNVGEAIFNIGAGIFVLYCVVFIIFARTEQRAARRDTAAGVSM